MTNADVIVIGAGASGMAAAIKAAERHKNTLLLEKSSKLGRKILASGNGRCNLMNSGIPRYYGDAEFAEQVLKRCSAGDIVRFFRQYGLMITEENEGRMYPFTFQSFSVVSVLKNAMHLTGVSLISDFSVHSIRREKNEFAVRNENGDILRSKELIIACGGSAQPQLGGTSDGYRILKSFGHSIIPVFPSLVPLETDQKSISGLAGIRAHCTISLLDGNHMLHSEKGEILFTEYGVSGICVMQCARFTEGRRTQMEICFMDGIFHDNRELTEELCRRQALFSDLSPVCLFDGILHERIAYAILKQAGIALRGETSGDLTDRNIQSIAETAFHYKIGITGTRGFQYAQVTAGGADCREFDPMTMESRIVPGLYAAGEVLNVDGDCGGFNLMFAFSSGILAGQSVCSGGDNNEKG